MGKECEIVEIIERIQKFFSLGKEAGDERESESAGPYSTPVLTCRRKSGN